jgi:hypothetical protein
MTGMTGDATSVARGRVPSFYTIRSSNALDSEVEQRAGTSQSNQIQELLANKEKLLAGTSISLISLLR